MYLIMYVRIKSNDKGNFNEKTLKKSEPILLYQADV